MMNSTFLKLYYTFRPLLPRWMQIHLRRKIVQLLRGSYSNVWPIDRESSQTPEGWPGWPDGKRFAFVMTHDVETAKGCDRVETLADLEEEVGLRSSFNFVPERYTVSPDLRQMLQQRGFEVGVHGLNHDGKLYASRRVFQQRAERINHYLKDWGVSGFRSPAMHHELEWIHDLNIAYDASTFDTDPFEPQSDGMGTIFPFLVTGEGNSRSYVEIPYTLPQDSTLFIFMQEKSLDVWKKKLEWIVDKGGMALFIAHPDYMCFDKNIHPPLGEYPVSYYRDFLNYVAETYKDQFWNATPSQIAQFWRENKLP